MIEAINRYLRLGWSVSANMHQQIVFYDCDTNKFFALGGATKKEIEHLEYAKRIGYGIGLRKRFIH